MDRYISRLVSLKRLRDALALYRREIDRNPNDPGLYERLAAFLEENKLGDDIEQVYRRAMAQFSDRGWTQKLARWYLRHKRTAQFEQLTQEVVKIFSGLGTGGLYSRELLAAKRWRRCSIGRSICTLTSAFRTTWRSCEIY